MKNEFNALTRGLLKHSSDTSSLFHLAAKQRADASAIHERLGAQVALLQSPILPTAKSNYFKRKHFRGLPIDKPHTCPSVVEKSGSLSSPISSQSGSAPLRLCVFALRLARPKCPNYGF